MTHKIGIYYNEKGLRDIMKSSELAELELRIMEEKLHIIEAAFFQRFGFAGAFEIRKVDTNSKRSRTTFRICASDAKTGAILNREPEWLAQFI